MNPIAKGVPFGRRSPPQQGPCSTPFHTLAEVDRLRRQQDPRAGGRCDHAAEARTARNTVVSRSASVPGTTRSTAPASSISSDGEERAGATVGPGSGCDIAGTIGTKSSRPAAPTRISRRQVKTCCGQTCRRRATSATTAPGFRVSATIRALSSADHFRRRPGPVRTSTRRYPPPFASSLTSTITSARSSQPQADQPYSTPAPEGGPRRRTYPSAAGPAGRRSRGRAAGRATRQGQARRRCGSAEVVPIRRLSRGLCV